MRRIFQIGVHVLISSSRERDDHYVLRAERHSVQGSQCVGRFQGGQDAVGAVQFKRCRQCFVVLDRQSLGTSDFHEMCVERSDPGIVQACGDGIGFQDLTVFVLHDERAETVEHAFRAGILAVDQGQTEAARSLGLSRWQSMRLVVLPQAIKNVLPALANEVVTMVKESSICSVLGMAEMMFAAKTIAGSTGISLAPYTMAALVYFCINYPASKAIEAIERRMRRGDKQ